MQKKKIKVCLLIDSFCIESWIYDIIRTLSESDFIDISLAIVNDSKSNNIIQETESCLNLTNEKAILSRFDRIKKELKRTSLFHEYVKWDREFYSNWQEKLYNQFNIEFNNSFEIVDCESLLKSIKLIKVCPDKKKYSDYFFDEDISRIKKFDIDVIIRFGFRILKGDILSVAKYGIWSFHHDDNRYYRGSPPLFWEIYDGNPASGTILQVLTSELDGGKLIYRSIASTQKNSWFLNSNDNYWKTSTFVYRCLKVLHKDGWGYFKDLDIYNEKLKYSKKIYKTPNNKQMIKFYSKLLFREIGAIYRAHFFQEYWKIVIRLKSKTKFIIAEKNHWYADPFIIKKDNLYYLFFEDMDIKTNKGVISYKTITPDGKVSYSRKILEKEYHLSYPFIFEYDGNIYMIPETKDAKGIDLYRANNFPEDWIFVKRMINNVNAVDTNIIYYEKQWWLFTNIAEHGANPSEELYIYYSDSFFGNWISHKYNPVISDAGKARGAGALYVENGILFRPSQNCLKTYGHKININKVIRLSKIEYKEEKVDEIQSSIFGISYKGTHTINKYNDLMCYDVKSYKWNKNLNILLFLRKIKYIYFHKPLRLYLKHILKILILNREPREFN